MHFLFMDYSWCFLPGEILQVQIYNFWNHQIQSKFCLFNIFLEFVFAGKKKSLEVRRLAMEAEKQKRAALKAQAEEAKRLARSRKLHFENQKLFDRCNCHSSFEYVFSISHLFLNSKNK